MARSSPALSLKAVPKPPPRPPAAVYEIRSRMDDGGRRSFTRDQAYVVGQKLRVEGDQLSLRN